MSNIFKVNTKDTRTTYGVSVVNFEQILYFILLLIAGFNQITASWAWETTVSDNKVVFRTVRNILSYGLGKFAGVQDVILVCPKRGYEGTTFHDSISQR